MVSCGLSVVGEHGQMVNGFSDRINGICGILGAGIP